MFSDENNVVKIDSSIFQLYTNLYSISIGLWSQILVTWMISSEPNLIQLITNFHYAWTSSTMIQLCPKQIRWLKFEKAFKCAFCTVCLSMIHLLLNEILLHILHSHLFNKKNAKMVSLCHRRLIDNFWQNSKLNEYANSYAYRGRLQENF